MKFYVTENAAYSLEDVHKVEKDENWLAFDCRSRQTYLLKLVYNNRPKEIISYFSEEERDKAFDEILDILKGE